MSRPKLTRLNRPVVRQINFSPLGGGRRMVIRIDRKGLWVWIKRGRVQQRITFRRLWQIVEKLMAERQTGKKQKKLLLADRKQVQEFIELRRQGYTAEQLEDWCARQSIRQHRNKRAWSWSAIELAVNREIKRQTRAEARRKQREMGRFYGLKAKAASQGARGDGQDQAGR